MGVEGLMSFKRPADWACSEGWKPGPGWVPDGPDGP